MLKAPRTPGMSISGTGNVIKTFVRLHQVSGGIACLQAGRKSYEYRAIIKVNTVNFALMSADDQDALIEGFKGFLNGLAFPIQILIRNLPYRLDEYLNSLDTTPGDLAEVIQDHASFVRQLASRRALVKRAFYIIVPADPVMTRNTQEALVNAGIELKLRSEELLRQIERLGLNGHRLTDKEIIALYQSCFLSDEARQFPLTDNLIEGANHLMVSARSPDYPHAHFSQKDSASPEKQVEDEEELAAERKQAKRKKSARKTKLPDLVSIPELIAPSSIEIFPWCMRISGEVGQEFVRTLAFVNYPRSAYPGWLDAIIQVDEPSVDFSIHIKPLSPQQVTARLGKKAVEFRGFILPSQHHGRIPDPTTIIALQDIETLRDQLARGDERIFTMSVFVQVRWRTRRELGERNNRIVSAIRSLDFRALPAPWQHHVGFLSCLPDNTNQLGRGRLFGTSSAATFYPFTGSDISMERGAMFGVHPNGSLIILDPFNSSELENANLVVFAKSGAGKSFFLKTGSFRFSPS